MLFIQKMLIMIAITSFISCAMQPVKWTDYEKTPEETFNEAMGESQDDERYLLNVKKEDDYDFESPYKPVMTPPEVVPAWIYDHVTPGDATMVTGHWIFIKLREPTWYLQKYSPESDRKMEHKVPTNRLQQGDKE